MKATSQTLFARLLAGLIGLTACLTEAAKQRSAHNANAAKRLARRKEFRQKPTQVALAPQPYLKGKKANFPDTNCALSALCNEQDKTMNF